MKLFLGNFYRHFATFYWSHRSLQNERIEAATEEKFEIDPSGFDVINKNWVIFHSKIWSHWTDHAYREWEIEGKIHKSNFCLEG